MKRIAILGSTGSIGAQALEVVRQHPGRFRVTLLTALGNCDLLAKQAAEFRPDTVVIGNKDCFRSLSTSLAGEPVRVFAGSDALADAAANAEADLVVSAMVGYAGLLPTLHAIRAGRHIALANKETLVVAGDLVMREAREHGVNILPVDSEHSAIFQCLEGEDRNAVEKIILTASGGPFRGWTRDRLKTVTPAEALRHPRWKMGNKITIDSATLMNKGLEVIEARWLFDLPPEKIDVVVHPESVIHSMVQFIDGSVKAQMGLPDMRLPILYAFSHPERMASALPRFSFAHPAQMTFEPPDTGLFRTLPLAYDALRAGGNMPCVLNAANEAAVGAFLDERIAFDQIPDVIEHCMAYSPFLTNPGYHDYVATHAEAGVRAGEYLSRNPKKTIIINTD